MGGFLGIGGSWASLRSIACFYSRRWLPWRKPGFWTLSFFFVFWDGCWAWQTKDSLVKEPAEAELKSFERSRSSQPPFSIRWMSWRLRNSCFYLDKPQAGHVRGVWMKEISKSCWQLGSFGKSLRLQVPLNQCSFNTAIHSCSLAGKWPRPRWLSKGFPQTVFVVRRRGEWLENSENSSENFLKDGGNWALGGKGFKNLRDKFRLLGCYFGWKADLGIARPCGPKWPCQTSSAAWSSWRLFPLEDSFALKAAHLFSICAVLLARSCFYLVAFWASFWIHGENVKIHIKSLRLVHERLQYGDLGLLQTWRCECCLPANSLKWAQTRMKKTFWHNLFYS